MSQAAPKGAEALGHLEDVVVKAGGAVLRYGSFYGTGAIEGWVELVRKRQFPLVGGGTGYLSWVHLDASDGRSTSGSGSPSRC
jgi:hypothetical protein